jgi:hypothetical protein
MNLYEETLRELEYHSKKPKDVLWVGSSDGRYAVSWEKFEQLASGVNYDEGYGGQEIDRMLVIVGDNWWMDRREYDGSEWWTFNTKPELRLSYVGWHWAKNGYFPFEIDGNFQE